MESQMRSVVAWPDRPPWPKLRYANSIVLRERIARRYHRLRPHYHNNARVTPRTRLAPVDTHSNIRYTTDTCHVFCSPHRYCRQTGRNLHKHFYTQTPLLYTPSFYTNVTPRNIKLDASRTGHS